MGMDEDRARASVRFSLGWTSRAGDVDRVLAVIGDVVRGAERAAAAA
jgi:cysteine desulfurase